MEKVLKIYELVNDVVTPFPNSTLQAELYSFQYDCKRMGNAPTIMGTIMYPLCLDNLWNDKVFVQFNDEKYFIDLTPSSSYSNTDTRYKHDITFVSERRVLEDVYFKNIELHNIDGVEEVIDIKTDFSFFGDIHHFADFLNKSLQQDNIEYACIVDDTIKTEEKEFSVSNIKINDVLQQAFGVYNIPYYFVGKEIHFGFYENVIPHVFKYGADKQLLSINKENSNTQPITKITGVGSSDNIHYYYPNLNPSGVHDIDSTPSYIKENIKSINYLKLDSLVNLREGDDVVFYKGTSKPIYDDKFKYINVHLYGHVDNKAKGTAYPSNMSNPYADGYSISYGQWVAKKFDNDYASSYSKVSYEILMPENDARPQNTTITIKIKSRLYASTNELTNFNYYTPVIENSSNTQVFLYQEHLSGANGEWTLSFNVPKGKGYIAFSLYFYHNGVTDYFGSNKNNKYNFTFSYKHEIVFNDNNWAIDIDVDGNKNSIISSIKDGLTFDKRYGSQINLSNIKYSVTKVVNQYQNIIINPKLILDLESGRTSIGIITKTESITPTKYSVSGIDNTLYKEIKFDQESLELRIKEDCVVTIEFEYNDFSIDSTELGNTTGTFTIIPDFKNIQRVYRLYDYFYFVNNDKEIKYELSGIKLENRTLAFDGTMFSISPTIKWIAPRPYLMPYKYRETLGEDLWYKALNDTYINDDGEYIVFKNTFNEKKPKEYIADPKEDIKPTIVGVTNAQGQRIDMLADVAFDTNDNNIDWRPIDNGSNESRDTEELVHSFFFVKLRKTDGEDGFNLFDQSIENGEMTIVMTSGHCGSCEFKIMVNEDGQNTVQVDENGDLVRDEDGNVKFDTPQDIQQDTSKSEVWIALLKEQDSYGIILPDSKAHLIPTTEDTFVITNIMLPIQYITRAERKLEQQLIQDMLEQNTDKFNFSINISRIFLGQNPTILNTLNENAQISVLYNNIKYSLAVSSFSYKMDNNSPLPQITVELQKLYSKTSNINNNKGTIIINPNIGKYEDKISNKLAVTSSRLKNELNKKIDDVDYRKSIVQKTGDSRNMIMSQYAVTKAIEDNKTKVSQYLGNSDTETISQKIITEQIYTVHDMIREIDTSKMQYVTYEELISLIKNDSLIEGMQYRIIDYVTKPTSTSIYVEEGVIVTSAEHPFDLIVTAISSNTIDCDAQAVPNPNVTYFDTANLQSWKIKYRVGNLDLSDNSKGTIYYMKDQNDNEASYDFKNIQFTFTEDYPYQIPDKLQYNTPYYTFTMIVKGCTKYNKEDIPTDKIESGYVGDASLVYWLSVTNENGAILFRGALNNSIFINHRYRFNNNIFISLFDNYNNITISTSSYNTIYNGNVFLEYCNYCSIKAEGIYKNLQNNIVQKNSQGDIKIFNLADLIV